MNVLAVIPARGGSKGLKDKNIRPLLDHPLIAYSILAARRSRHITRTIVSTDSEAIAEVARKYGAEVPFMRPAALAADMSTDKEVFEHALAWLKQTEHYVPDFIVQLRPTSPLRHASEIDACIEKMINNPEADSLRIVTEAPCTPFKMWYMEQESPELRPLLDLPGVAEPYNEPRQRLPKVYWQVGTLDVIRTTTLTEKHSLCGSNILGHEIPQREAVDIDDLASFDRAASAIIDNGGEQF